MWLSVTVVQPTCLRFCVTYSVHWEQWSCFLFNFKLPSFTPHDLSDAQTLIIALYQIGKQSFQQSYDQSLSIRQVKRCEWWQFEVVTDNVSGRVNQISSWSVDGPVDVSETSASQRAHMTADVLCLWWGQLWKESNFTVPSVHCMSAYVSAAVNIVLIIISTISVSDW